MRFGHFFRRWCAAALLPAGVVVSSICSSSVGIAQVIMLNGVDGSADPTNGFKVKKVDAKITDAMTDFSRYCEKQAWEKAFQAIAPLADTEVTGMIPSQDGFYFPARQAVMKTFLSMSAEGRDAYRLFNDAKAKQLFEQATNHSDSSDDDLPTLRKLAGIYFITSVGQQAANRLGDDLFETGDFAGAEQAWASIVDQQAGSDLDIPRIQFKRGVAMARSNQAARVKEIIAWLKEHAADSKSRVGGKEVQPAEYLQSLIATPATTQSSDFVEADLPPLALPESDTPKWHFNFGDQQAADKISQTLNMFGWGNMMPDLLDIIPGSAADDKHAYINWLGVCYGLDARTGKLLWRTDKPGDIGQQAQMFVQFCPEPKRYTVAAAGDRALFVRIPPKRMNFQEPYRLTCFNAQTGAQQWSSDSGTLAGYSFSCIPLVVNDVVYTTAAANNGSELFLVAVNLASGKSLWTLSLGQVTAGSNWRGMPEIPICNMLFKNGTIYVLTNNGALLAVSVEEKRVLWAFSCEGPEVFDRNSGQTELSTFRTPAALFVRDGIFYFKEASADTMYAIDLAGPTLKWKRPVSTDETIVGMDGSRVYTAGQDVGAIDLGSRDLLWSTRLPQESGMYRPMMSGDSIFYFLGRGVYQLDAASGDVKRVFRGYDRDSQGGAIYQSAIGMITVSNQALTAYAMPGPRRAD